MTIVHGHRYSRWTAILGATGKSFLSLIAWLSPLALPLSLPVHLLYINAGLKPQLPPYIFTSKSAFQAAIYLNHLSLASCTFTNLSLPWRCRNLSPSRLDSIDWHCLVTNCPAPETFCLLAPAAGLDSFSPNLFHLWTAAGGWLLTWDGPGVLQKVVKSLKQSRMVSPDGLVSRLADRPLAYRNTCSSQRSRHLNTYPLPKGEKNRVSNKKTLAFYNHIPTVTGNGLCETFVNQARSVENQWKLVLKPL